MSKIRLWRWVSSAPESDWASRGEEDNLALWGVAGAHSDCAVLTRRNFSEPLDNSLIESVMITGEMHELYDRQLPSHVISQLNELRAESHLCDVELEVEGSLVQAHRVVLSAGIPYFRAMFQSNMKEANQRIIAISEISMGALRQIIDYVYTGKILITSDNVQGLLSAASFLMVDRVRLECEKFLSDFLTTQNCLTLRNFAEQHNCGSLLSSTHNFALQHFSELRLLPDFRCIPFAQLRDLIKRSDLNVNNEQEVFETVMEWVEEDGAIRVVHLRELLSFVRLTQLARNFLKQIVVQHPLIRADPVCLEQVALAIVDMVPGIREAPLIFQSPPSEVDEKEKKKVKETGGEYEPIASENAKRPVDMPSSSSSCSSSSYAVRPISPSNSSLRPRKSYAGVIFCVGGRGTAGDPFRTVEAYDWRRNTWFSITEMTTQRRHVGVVSAHGKLYAIGGHDGTNHLSSAECYDPAEKKWITLAHMRTSRRGIAVGALEDALYAVGGLDDAACFQTVERYDMESNTWTNVAKMVVQRGGVGVSALGKHLYAVGGNDGTSSLESCERYDPHLDKWKLVANMRNRRAGAGVTVVDGYLYAMGGFDDNAPLKTCERYDPSRDEWTQLAPMSCPRGGVGVAAMGGLVYAIGGHDGIKYLSSVEAYDPVTNDWRPVADIQECRAGAGVAWSDTKVAEILRPSHRGQDSGCAPHAGSSPCV